MSEGEGSGIGARAQNALRAAASSFLITNLLPLMVAWGSLFRSIRDSPVLEILAFTIEFLASTDECTQLRYSRGHL